MIWCAAACYYLADEAVVDDGAADGLEELEQRLHLAHADCSSSTRNGEKPHVVN